MAQHEWKVGDRITLTGTVVELDFDSDDRRVRLHWDGTPEYVSYWPNVAALPHARLATRHPWDVLREAAAVLQGNVWHIVRDHLTREADRLEAAARPPSLLDAAKEIAAAWARDPHIMDDRMARLHAAIAAAEREAGQ